MKLPKDIDPTLQEVIDKAVDEALERAARGAYIICAETRHVTLGDKVVDFIGGLRKNQERIRV